MANTYAWEIMKLTYNSGPDDEGHTDIVVRIDWALHATSEDEQYKARVIGRSEIEVDPEVQWIPYDEITEAQVVSWVEGSKGEDGMVAMKNGLDGNIRKQEHPKSTSANPGKFPWDEDDGA